MGDTYSGAPVSGKQGGFQGEITRDNPVISNVKKPKTNIPDKCLIMIPFRFAIEMVSRGWILRNTIIWHKRNCMPSSAKDRFTVDFEYLFFFSKKKKYYFEQQFDKYSDETIPRMLRGVSDHHKWTEGADGQGKHTMSQPRKNRKYDDTNYGGDGLGFQGHSGYKNANGELMINEKGRNKRTVWTINPKPFSEAHFAVYPEELCEIPIKSGCPEFVCKKCGKPREIIYESQAGTSNECPKTQVAHIARGGVGEPSGTVGKSGSGRIEPSRTFIGYTDCGCNAGFEGGIVYDPFAGSGTTGLVAHRLNRNYILSEIKKEYCEITEKRLQITKQIQFA